MLQLLVGWCSECESVTVAGVSKMDSMQWMCIEMCKQWSSMAATVSARLDIRVGYLLTVTIR